MVEQETPGKDLSLSTSLFRRGSSLLSTKMLPVIGEILPVVREFEKPAGRISQSAPAPRHPREGPCQPPRQSKLYRSFNLLRFVLFFLFSEIGSLYSVFSDMTRSRTRGFVLDRIIHPRDRRLMPLSEVRPGARGGSLLVRRLRRQSEPFEQRRRQIALGERRDDDHDRLAGVFRTAADIDRRSDRSA